MIGVLLLTFVMVCMERESLGKLSLWCEHDATSYGTAMLHAAVIVVVEIENSYKFITVHYCQQGIPAKTSRFTLFRN